MREHGLYCIDRTEKVDIHLPLGIVYSRELYGSGYAVAGIGDKHIHRLRLPQHLCHSLTDRRLLHHIAVNMRYAVVTRTVAAEFKHPPALLTEENSSSQAYARTATCYE